jgi:hypothetical protein
LFGIGTGARTIELADVIKRASSPTAQPLFFSILASVRENPDQHLESGEWRVVVVRNKKDMVGRGDGPSSPSPPNDWHRSRCS